MPLNSWVLADQIHGNNVEVVDDSDCGKGSYKLNDAIRNTDGLITNKSNILIAALFADCVPLFFLAKKEFNFCNISCWVERYCRKYCSKNNSSISKPIYSIRRDRGSDWSKHMWAML